MTIMYDTTGWPDRKWRFWVAILGDSIHVEGFHDTITAYWSC